MVLESSENIGNCPSQPSGELRDSQVGATSDLSLEKSEASGLATAPGDQLAAPSSSESSSVVSVDETAESPVTTPAVEEVSKALEPETLADLPGEAPASQESLGGADSVPVAADSATPELTISSVDYDHVVELPPSDSAKGFKGSLETLRLPDICCGQPFECLIKLYSPTNGFRDKVSVQEVVCVKSQDLSVDYDAEKGWVWLHGTPQTDTCIQLRFRYRMLGQTILGFGFGGAGPVNECIKELSVRPDPVTAWEGTIQALCKNGWQETPIPGVVGEAYRRVIPLETLFANCPARLSVLECKVSPVCGLTASLNSDNTVVVEGTPNTPGNFLVSLRCSLQTGSGQHESTFTLPAFSLLPERVFDLENKFRASCPTSASHRAMAGTQVEFEVSLPPIPAGSGLVIRGAAMSDPDLTVSYDEVKNSVRISGAPKVPGVLSVSLSYEVHSNVRGNLAQECSLPVLQVTPDPKTLWKDLPTDSTAPYQAENVEFVTLPAGERTIVAASKRGRSHAHDGRFRDDNYGVSYLKESGWFIISVSDGAGSARYSREGSRIACSTFLEVMSGKLSSPEINAKLDGMTAENRETILKNTILSAVYEGLKRIDAEAKSAKEKDPSVVRKDYAATFLCYVMKKYGDKWLIVSMGIGDGIIGVLDKADALTLLSEPDGGEFVGQTRFITMNEVWQDAPIKRLRSAQLDDFKVIMSMSDGVSDPKFETDNNLKNETLWHELYQDISGQVPLDDRSDETSQKLSDWLDFWSKGNHDDRTIVLVY